MIKFVYFTGPHWQASDSSSTPSNRHPCLKGLSCELLTLGGFTAPISQVFLDSEPTVVAMDFFDNISGEGLILGRNLLIAVLLSAIVVISGCQWKHEQVTHEQEQVAYKEISPQEALALMEEDLNVILLDVRTEEEFQEKHIPGSVLIPDYELAELAAQMLPDKDATILVYCRTGRRSEAPPAVDRDGIYQGLRPWVLSTGRMIRCRTRPFHGVFFQTLMYCRLRRKMAECYNHDNDKLC